jgi:hypothetical protein
VAEAHLVSSFDLGVTVPQPLGSAGDTLSHSAGVRGSVWFETPKVLPESVQFNLATEFLPFSFQNVAGANNVQANLGVYGIYGGIGLWGGPTFLGMRPMFAVDIGALYDWMYFPTANGTALNAAWAFAFRVEPGLDVPLFSHLGLLIEFPMTVATQKNTLAIWESSFSLRWKL